MKRMKTNDGSEAGSVDKLSLAFTCRTCLNTDSDQQLTPIFEDIKASNKFCLFDQLLLLKLKIAKDDGYPANICSICMERFEAVDAFRKQCETAQEYLEQNFVKLPKQELELNADNLVCFVEDLKPLDDARNSEPQEYDENEVQLDIKEENAESTEIRIDHECALCEMKFTETSKYQYHQESHHNWTEKPKKVYKCIHCEASFDNQNRLKSHKLTHKKKRSYLCNICGKSFLRENSLKWHLKVHDDNVEKFTCDVCNKQFQRKDSLRIHLDIHLNKRPYQCDQCGMKFNHQNTLKGHLKLHNAEKTHHCEFCEESFLRSYDLKRHRLMVHNRTEASVQIDLQSLQENDESTVKVPVNEEQNPPKKRRKRPTEYKAYSCDVCDKSFKIPSALENHVKIHREDRKYVCKECGDAFRTILHLQNHINAIHLKQKPYSCEVCKKSFARVGDRNRHLQMHSASKPHQCTVCGKGFAWARSLQAHIRDHTGEKPYVCIICNAGFSRHENLARHTRIAHIEVQMKIQKEKTTSTTSPVVYGTSTIVSKFDA